MSKSAAAIVGGVLAMSYLACGAAAVPYLVLLQQIR